MRLLVGYARGRVDDAAADAQFAVDAVTDQCFITRNTVAWHLRNDYRKLQIESRAQLPAPSATDVRPPGTEWSAGRTS